MVVVIVPVASCATIGPTTRGGGGLLSPLRDTTTVATKPQIQATALPFGQTFIMPIYSHVLGMLMAQCVRSLCGASKTARPVPPFCRLTSSPGTARAADI